MNRTELKKWFFGNCPDMLQFWVEAEKTICGSSNLEQAMSDRKITNPHQWLLHWRDADSKPHDTLRKDVATALDFSVDTPQEFDAGTFSLTSWKSNASRFVYLDNTWYSHCGVIGVKSAQEIAAIKSQIRHRTIPPVTMTVGWRLNSAS